VEDRETEESREIVGQNIDMSLGIL